MITPILAILLAMHPGGQYKAGPLWLIQDWRTPESDCIRQAYADWVFRVNGRPSTVVWVIRPFVPVDPPRSRHRRVDAALELIPMEKRLGVKCRVLVPTDQTDLDRNKQKAAVAMAVAGFGKGRVRLRVGIADRFVAAGKYCAEVRVTVSAH